MSSVSLTAELLTKITKEIEETFSHVYLAKHATLIYLQWGVAEFRESVLRSILSKVPAYLRGAKLYNFKDHFRYFHENLFILAQAHNIVLSQSGIDSRQLKGFLLACVNVAYQFLFPDETEQSLIDMRTFQEQFSSVPDFQGAEVEWQVALHYRNYMAISLNLIPFKNNTLMLAESCAILCGINKCFHGQNTGKGVKRLLRVRDSFDSLHALKADNVVLPLPPSEPSLAEDLFGATTAAAAAAAAAGTTVSSTTDDNIDSVDVITSYPEVVFSANASSVAQLIEVLQAWHAANPHLPLPNPSGTSLGNQVSMQITIPRAKKSTPMASSDSLATSSSSSSSLSSSSAISRPPSSSLPSKQVVASSSRELSLPTHLLLSTVLPVEKELQPAFDLPNSVQLVSPTTPTDLHSKKRSWVPLPIFMKRARNEDIETCSNDILDDAEYNALGANEDERFHGALSLMAMRSKAELAGVSAPASSILDP